jgi:hypothetical protein
MRLTPKAIEKIKESTRLKARLALVLNKSGYTIERWVSENEDNGDLTKVAAIQVIKEEAQLSDNEILEEITESESAGAA